MRLVFLAMLLVGQVRAADPVTQSRLNFEAGLRLYQAGQYDDALRAFQSGYQLAARPPFLINIGQCLRALHRYKEARAAFARFLVDAPTRDPRRKGAEEMVAELDREISQLPPEPPPPPVPVASPAPQPPVVATPLPPPPPPIAVVQKPKPRRHWWLIPVTLTVAAGIAVGLGVGLTLRPCPQGDLCVVADGAK